MAKHKCVWPGTEVRCNGEVKERSMLNGEIDLPVCESHYEVYNSMMKLRDSGYDMETQILKMNEREIVRLALVITMSGI